MEGHDHHINNQDNFDKRFVDDLNGARGLVLIQSPFLSPRRIYRLQPLLQSCTERGVRVCVFAQQPDPRDTQTEAGRLRIQNVERSIEILSDLRVHVTLRELIHEKIAVIDETVLWDGSLNILSYFVSKERMTRWQSRAKVREAILMHALNSCLQCHNSLAFDLAFGPDGLISEQSQILGAAVMRRRFQLGLTQSELAQRVTASQGNLSRLETGKALPSPECLINWGKEVGLGLRYIPWYLLPLVDELCGGS